MMPKETAGTLIQCDFDGTITEKDMGFMLMDAFADNKDWRHLLDDLRDGRISIGRFNTKAFSMIKHDKPTLSAFVRENVKIRPGFQDFLDICRKENYKFVIVSNGLDFYIEEILSHRGIGDVEVVAAKTFFTPDGIDARYFSPEGEQIQEGLKESYTSMFLKNGYRVVYIGNGISDAPPAEQSHHIFARESLADYCEGKKLEYTPFADFNDVIRGMKLTR